MSINVAIWANSEGEESRWRRTYWAPVTTTAATAFFTGRTSVARARTLLPISVGSLFTDLTHKQVDALLTSYGMGYFKFPRRRDVKNIASAKGIPRTTFQEHLTKAENKIVAGVVPYLRFLDVPGVSTVR